MQKESWYEIGTEDGCLMWTCKGMRAFPMDELVAIKERLQQEDFLHRPMQIVKVTTIREVIKPCQASS